MPTPNQFKQLIKDHGYTYKQVGLEIGLQPTTLSSYLNHRTLDLPKAKYIRLCELLEVEVRF